MQYPKPVMNLSQLKKMGFPEDWLLYIYHKRSDKKIAWRTGRSQQSSLLFDTEELEKYRRAQCTGE